MARWLPSDPRWQEMIPEDRMKFALWYSILEQEREEQAKREQEKQEERKK